MTQNKFAISWQYLKKEVSDEDKHFLAADKQESFLQNWYYDFNGDSQAFAKFPK